MTTFMLHVVTPRASLRRDVTATDPRHLAAVLERWLPEVAREDGRAGAFIERDGVLHLVARVDASGRTLA
jgi:hypothetical protein